MPPYFPLGASVESDGLAMPYHLHNEAQNRTVGLCIECGWQVRFACENGHGGGFTVAELRDRFAPAVTLEQIAARLVCATCGSRDGDLTVRQDPAARLGRDMKDTGFLRPQT